MSEEQFAELRDYTDGRPLSTGYKPSASLIRNGWLRRVVDDFYEITSEGERAFEQMRAPTRGEHEAEGRAVEANQEEKHGDW